MDVSTTLVNSRTHHENSSCWGQWNDRTSEHGPRRFGGHAGPAVRRCVCGSRRGSPDRPGAGRADFQIVNAITLIIPYRYDGMWVFDDPRVGLDKEPFVSGADTMIDVMVREIPGAQQGFRLLFSATLFPGYKVRLEWKREEYGGNWYYSPEFQMEGWLCPALFKYFEKAPREIYVKAEPKE